MAKILLVDDRRPQIRALQILFGRKGIKEEDVFLAECVDDAVAIYMANPDLELLVTDCKMPINKSGINVDNAGKQLLVRLRLAGFDGSAVLRTSVDNCDDHDFAFKFTKFVDPEVVIAKCVEILEQNTERGRELRNNK